LQCSTGVPDVGFRQLFDPASSTYTYLLADGRSAAAVIIDPVFEQIPPRMRRWIEELGFAADLFARNPLSMPTTSPVRG